MAQAVSEATLAESQGVSSGDARASFVVQRRGEAQPWDSTVVSDLLAFDYVRAVLFTDGDGEIVHRAGLFEGPSDLGEGLDIAIAAVEQAGRALSQGQLTMNVSIFREGTLVTGANDVLRATVIASPTSNLGQLLSHMRRLLAGDHA